MSNPTTEAAAGSTPRSYHIRLDGSPREAGRFNAPMRPDRIFVSDVLAAAADYYGLTVTDIISASQKRACARPRQVAFYVARRITGLSYPVIARSVGDRHHTTVIFGARKVEKLAAGDRMIAHAVNAIAITAARKRDQRIARLISGGFLPLPPTPAAPAIGVAA